MTTSPILFVGGSGVVGRAAVKWFRKRHPDLCVLIGGRNVQAATEFAEQVGAARAVAIDLDKPQMGLDDDIRAGGVMMLGPDDALNGLRYAQEHGVPYLNIGNGLVEMGPEVAHFAHRPKAAPVVLASQWAAGAAVFLALDSARDLDRVQSIRIGVLLDSEDPAGPLAYEDMERTSAPATLVFKEGRRTWISEEDAKGTFSAIDGRVLTADAYSPFDIISLHAATAAADIRLDLITDESSSRRKGGPAAAEIVVEVEGARNGQTAHVRSTLEFKHGQASLTGLCAVLSLSAALGLHKGAPALPGLYLPELLSEPQWFLNELRAEGATLSRTQP
ncbi:hypothetical protein EGJ27_12885 [Pseudomonas sp. v388]|uniref:hypothetical protein n=1 Tax=Pseudomonas sp. v388 TaxID=2479849 RepID=UPI000F7B96E2|nr:hypothetical protein [Pseudomonas sp. v388]RRV07557.1 hypothetical protein EGJ27_12885 [Pseudomonas sp. v388]